MSDGGGRSDPDEATVALAAAAHEIKNALGPLGMTLQLAERQVQNGQPVAAGDLAFARAQVRRLADLVDDLLDLTRADLGQLPFRARSHDLRAVVREAVEILRRSKPIPVEIDLPQAPVVAAVDEARLQQVLSNLFANAARYCPAHLPITVSLRSAGGVARIEVRDRGPGIAPEEQGRIFDRFVRGAAAEGTSGLGIGLYLCRAIVERHGGRIGVESAPGAGATFWIEIPSG